MFTSVLWALQRQLPVEEEPPLLEDWQFLYARSIGCIGLLKMHLNRALNVALAEGARTVTQSHLRQTALSEARVELTLRNAIESEAELTEAEGADARLLAQLGLREASSPPSSQPVAVEQEQKQSLSRSQLRRRPGKRAEGRDATGNQPSGEEQAVG